MDRLGVEYEEVPNIGILGVLLTGRTVPALEVPPGLTRIGDSPRILRYLWGEYSGRLPAERTRFLEPTPAALELEQRFDRRLGNDVRVWAYAHIFRRRDLTLRTWGADEPQIPGWQRALLRLAHADAGLRRQAHARRHAGAGRPGAREDARGLRRGRPAARGRPPLPARRRDDVRRHRLRAASRRWRSCRRSTPAAAFAGDCSRSTTSMPTGAPRSRAFASGPPGSSCCACIATSGFEPPA